MGHIGRSRSVIAVLLGAILVLSVAEPAVAAPPDVTVRVSGSTLADGGSVTVTENPEVAIEVSAESTINSVSVRVDGDPERTFSPDSQSFSETVTLDMTDGTHDLTVVASADETTTLTGSVTKDSTGPRVRYTSPFTTTRQGAPDDVETVVDGNTTIAGDLYDRTGVERIVIEREYQWQFAGRTRTARQTHRINDPGDSFSRPLLLGPGANEMRVRLIDVHGHDRIQTWTIDLNDREAPEIRIDALEWSSSGSEVRITGTVSDNTKVRSLSYTPDGSSTERSVLSQVDSEPTRERLSSEFEFTANAGSGSDSITLIAEDTAGNTRTREVSLNYEEQVTPTVSIDREATVADGDQIHVVGSVTQGRVDRVTVETVSDGEILDLRTVHDGDPARRVTIDERLAGAGEGTEVVVRAVDVTGEEHTQSYRVRGQESGSGGETRTASDAGGETPGEDTPPSDARDTPASDGTNGGGDGDEAEQNQVESDGGGFSIPLSGPIWLVAAAVVLAGAGLFVWRGGGSDSDAGGSAAAPAEGGDGPPEPTPTDDHAADGPQSDASDAPADFEPPAEFPDVIDADSVEAVEQADVDALVEALDDDDSETVAAAARTLGLLAAERPALELGGAGKLRDLRFAPDDEVSEAASGALDQFEDR
jgi:type 1 fimbria pilin